MYIYMYQVTINIMDQNKKKINNNLKYTCSLFPVYFVFNPPSAVSYNNQS